MSLYKLTYSCPLRTSFDWNTLATTTVTEKLGQEKARAIVTCIQEAIGVAQGHIRKAQEKKEKDINAYRREVDFRVEDKVFVTPKN